MSASALASLLAQGLALHQAGRLTEAMDFYAAVLRREPENFEALHGLGLVGVQGGRPQQGVDLIRKAIAINPDDAAAHVNLALGLTALSQFEAAVAACDRAAALAPGMCEPHFNRANALVALGDAAAALASYEAALAVTPDYLPAHANRAALLAALERYDEAVCACDAAIAIAPQSPEAHSNKSKILSDLKRSEDALASADRALALRGDYAEAHNNRAVALVDLGRPLEAIAACGHAIALTPDLADAYSNRGTALYDLGRPGEARASYDEALALQPGHAAAHFNRATSLLALGDLAAGFDEYRWRWRLPSFANRASPLPWPFWAGEPLPGKTILVHCEQGFGDALQFVRFATRLEAAQVTVLARPELVTLFRTLPGIEVTGALSPASAFDFQVPLMDLPHRLGTTLQTIPGETPYLFADRSKAGRWAERLRAEGDLTHVGLVWAGHARWHDPAALASDRRRSMALAQLEPLGRVPGVHFYSLQKGEPASQAVAAPFPLTDWTADLADFADTAALVQALDLVITVDTAVAHLAGALGKPVWVLSRFAGCWRWLNGREDSPWYPTARIFHQRAPGAWDEVAARVAAELAVFKPSRVG
ncbi:MAG TPA: tetratricopeptide repeat protein [Caulobacteraceae bacterium]|jgi:tetratricopeptide (TPR) repeat protein|nr:tetratricopeptide repeat protein [Caulobacteraceae bacterium]